MGDRAPHTWDPCHNWWLMDDGKTIHKLILRKESDGRAEGRMEGDTSSTSDSGRDVRATVRRAEAWADGFDFLAGQFVGRPL